MHIATRPGRPDQDNEDFVAAASTSRSTYAVLLDGAGGPRELPTGCTHGTPWYVEALGHRLLAAMRYPGQSLTWALKNGIGDLANAHSLSCDLTHPGTPSSTVVMVRVSGGWVDYLVLGDSTFAAELTTGEMVVKTDRRIDEVGRDLYQAMADLPTGTPEHQAARITYVTHQRSMRNRHGGFWIAAADPRAAEWAHTGRIAAQDVRRIALVSDGTARYVDFGLGSWGDLMNSLSSQGPDVVFDLVREAEAQDPHGELLPRAKRSDDVSAVAFPVAQPAIL